MAYTYAINPFPPHRWPAGDTPRARVLLILVVIMLIGGCSTTAGRAPDVVIPDAHTGGSFLATSPDSRQVASGGWSGWIRLWSLPEGTPRGRWRAHSDSVNGLVFLGDGSRLLSAGYDGRMAIWDLAGRLLREWDSGSPVTALATRQDRTLVLTGHSDGAVRLWHPDGRKIAEWAGVHRGAVRAVAMRRDGSRFASSGTDRRVFHWTQDSAPARLEDPPTDARTLVFTPGEKSLIGAGWFRLFRWDLPQGELHTLATEHAGIINDLNFLSDGRLASISRQTDSAVLLLDHRSGRTVERLQQHDLCGVAVSPSPDGRFLTTTSDDASVRIWWLDRSPDPEPRR
jgi:WD40 repeat protein